MIYQALRKVLFQMNPETAHDRTVQALKWMQSSPWLRQSIAKKMVIKDARLASKLWGLSFPNPIGLAAGFDKDADVFPALAALGFGFIEVGTLTPRPQSGNPQPRLFRLPGDEAVINRMGFNNHGIASARQAFEQLDRPAIPIGINLGKNKDTPNEKAAEDYILGLTELYPFGDYFVINVSSPNTKGLRDLQHAEALESLLTRILHQRDQSAQNHQQKKPLLLKIAPDLEPDAVQKIVSTAIAAGIDGIIATNTTLSREGLTSKQRHETGGLSGKPVRERSTQIIRHIYSITRGQIPLIGVGGVFTGRDVIDKLKAGANLVQVYTGMIYRGPAIVRKINQELLEWMEKEKISHFQEWIGQDLK
ncbi:quinone-dependent dihydroorotate dehydrogenase [Thermoactinomyces mirandus]|uniref:quinone-dependent dihydroorotate dehydrogenase n=1 Tax=Thermoactinomyces mirandus TaxID=2756294 RepID=UPI0028A773D5|nr:quinone-dependent dihydroorotate dehydrogenase [Thermoactinomyces mirandus]